MVAAFAAAALLVGTTGCEGDSTPRATGLGDAVVALHAGSMYGFDETLHGRVFLVARNGDVRVVPTDGIYLGSVTAADGQVHASDSASEIVIGQDAVTRMPRENSHDMEFWAGTVDGTFWTLFNDGTMGTSDYHTGVVAVRDGLVAEGDVIGDVVGVTTCAGLVTLAVGNWERPKVPGGTRLISLQAKGAKVEVTREDPVILPKGARVTNLACSGDRVLLLAQQGRRPLLGQEGDSESAAWDWRRPTGELGPIEFDEKVLGVSGSRLLLWSPHVGVYAVDLATLAAKPVLKLSSSADQVGMAGDAVIIWEAQPQPTIKWVDPDTGRVLLKVDGAGVEEVLRKEDEAILRAPLGLVDLSVL